MFSSSRRMNYKTTQIHSKNYEMLWNDLESQAEASSSWLEN